MNCPNCGKQTKPNAKFCTGCGTRLALSSNAATPKVGLTGRLPAQSILNNRYLILQKVGQGGMAAVYKVVDTLDNNRAYAIKEMSESALQPQHRQDAINAFHRESGVLRQLSHPNIPRVVDNFTQGAKHFLVMEFVHGKTLAEIAIERQNAGQRIQEQEVVSWCLQLCDVLEYLHAHNPPIIFRDLKPDNIMVLPNNKIKLIDFGIVRFFSPQKLKDTIAIGTPGYLAPEAINGQTDARSDLYSLAVTVHELVTGHNPASAQIPFQLPSLQALNAYLTTQFIQVIEKGLELKPQERWQSAREFRTALQQNNAFQQNIAAHYIPTTGAFHVPVGTPQPTLVKRKPRPTTRLVQAASKLSSKQLLGCLAIGVLTTVLFFVFITPILANTLIWDYLPIVALVIPTVFIATRKYLWAGGAHVILTLTAGFTIASQIPLVSSYLPSLFPGAVVSATAAEFLLQTNRFLTTSQQPNKSAFLDAWRNEMFWIAGIAAIATSVLYGFLFSNLTALLNLPGAFVIGCGGWFIGDLVREALKVQGKVIR